MRYCYQPWQIHILLENEMLKNVNFLKIGPRLDMPIGRQSFATITPMWNGASLHMHIGQRLLLRSIHRPFLT